MKPLGTPLAADKHHPMQPQLGGIVLHHLQRGWFFEIRAREHAAEQPVIEPAGADGQRRALGADGCEGIAQIALGILGDHARGLAGAEQGGDGAVGAPHQPQTTADFDEQGIEVGQGQSPIRVPGFEPQQWQPAFAEIPPIDRERGRPGTQRGPHAATEPIRQALRRRQHQQRTAGEATVHPRDAEIAAPGVALQSLQRNKGVQPVPRFGRTCPGRASRRAPSP